MAAGLAKKQSLEIGAVGARREGMNLGDRLAAELQACLPLGLAFVSMKIHELWAG